LSYDEETTCRGLLDTIARFGAGLPRPGAVLVGEPTLMQVADAHKSVATYTTIVHGMRHTPRNQVWAPMLSRRLAISSRGFIDLPKSSRRKAILPAASISGIHPSCRDDSWWNRAEYHG